MSGNFDSRMFQNDVFENMFLVGFVVKSILFFNSNVVGIKVYFVVKREANNEEFGDVTPLQNF